MAIERKLDNGLGVSDRFDLATLVCDLLLLVSQIRDDLHNLEVVVRGYTDWHKRHVEPKFLARLRQPEPPFTMGLSIQDSVPGARLQEWRSTWTFKERGTRANNVLELVSEQADETVIGRIDASPAIITDRRE